MSILIVTDSLPRAAGHARLIRTLADFWSRNGTEIRIVHGAPSRDHGTAAEPVEPFSRLEPPQELPAPRLVSYVYDPLSPLLPLGWLQRLRRPRAAVQKASYPRSARSTGFQEVQAHQPIPALSAATCGFLRRLPMTYVYHSPWGIDRWPQAGLRSGLPAPPKSHRLMESLALRRADRIVFLSRYMRDVACGLHDLPGDKCLVLAPPIDLEFFSPLGNRSEERGKWGAPEAAELLLVCRRLVPRMGVETLLEAFRLIHVRRPRIHLWLSGEGSHATALRRLAARSLPPQRYRFLGYVPERELSSLYRAAELFCLFPEGGEGFGLAGLEAMACGTPTVTCSPSGSAEWVKRWRSDFVGTSRDPDHLAALVGRCLDIVKKEGQSLRRQAQLFVQQHYCPETVADRFRAR